MFLSLIAFFGFSLLMISISSYEAIQTVTLSDQGFSPSTLTVGKGTTVNFLSQGKKPHWPASNFHPTHGEYPEGGGCIGSKLDACRGLKAGETYRFRFNQLGTWSMHDHLFPGHTLTIVVTKGHDPSQTAPLTYTDKDLPSVKAFLQLPLSEKQSLIKNLAKKNPALAWEYLRKLTQETQRNIDGHEFTHLIGNELYLAFGIQGISRCEKDFAYGCYHGVTEEMLLKKSISSIKEIESECMSIFKDSKKIATQGCIHGVGHGLISANNLDLLPTLKDCDLLEKANQQACYNGVFMEYTGAVANSPLNPHDPWSFCTKLAVPYQEMCASYFFKLLSKTTSFNFLEFAAVCEKAPNENLQESCMTNLTFEITHKAHGNVTTISDECRMIKTQKIQAFCFMAAARAVQFQEYADNNTSLAICAQIPKEFYGRCIVSLKKI